MKIINNASFKLIDRIISLAVYFNCDIYQIHDSVIGYGKIVITSGNNTSLVIAEKYLNCWSSTHTITYYTDIPDTVKSDIEYYYNNIDTE